MLGNSQMTNVQWEKWLKVVTTELMFSKESEKDDKAVHPLPWHCKYITNMFKNTDKIQKNWTTLNQLQPNDQDIPD